jgi:hypothetical protein
MFIQAYIGIRQNDVYLPLAYIVQGSLKLVA